MSGLPGMMVDESRSSNFGPQHGTEGLTFIPFDPASPGTSRKRGPLSPLSQNENPKRRIASEADRANMRAVKANGPCLRCKILKKQCNDEHPCKQCPKQDEYSIRDHWKVLGCHTLLANLAEICIPARLEKIERKLRDSTGCFRTIAIRPLEDTAKKEEVERLLRSSSAFKALTDNFWKNRIKFRWPLDCQYRRHGESTATDDEVAYNWEAAWELVKVTKTDPTYSSDTAYNPFTLFRNISDPSLRNFQSLTNGNYDESILALAERLLIVACATYQKEHQCQAALASASSKEPHADWSLLCSEYFLSISEPLEAYLSKFQDVCSKRGGLTPWQWVTTFYSLCLMSMVQSILLDSACILVEAEEACRWKLSDSIKIRSLYKALISIFCWAQGSSDLLGEDVAVNHYGNFDQILKGLKEMIQYEKWKERGIGSTKDFLMGLGQGKLGSGTSNGFFVQKWIYSVQTTKFRNSTLPSSIPKVSSPLKLQGDDTEDSPLSLLDMANSLPQTTKTTSSASASSIGRAKKSFAPARASPMDVIKGALDSLRSGGSISSQMKDELMLLGVSLESLRTPSSHTSSLRKLEKNLSLVFDCCGKRISTVDDLLEHYETYHSESMQVDTGTSGEDDHQDIHRAYIRASTGAITDWWLELET